MFRIQGKLLKVAPAYNRDGHQREFKIKEHVTLQYFKVYIQRFDHLEDGESPDIFYAIFARMKRDGKQPLPYENYVGTDQLLYFSLKTCIKGSKVHPEDDFNSIILKDIIIKAK